MKRDQPKNRYHKSRKDENRNDGKGFLPKDTEEFIKTTIDNLFLSLYRLPRKKIIKGEVSIEPHGYTALQREFQSRGKTTIEPILKSLRNRIERFAEQLPSGIQLQYEPADKILLGIGALSPYSNISLMTLHPVYGIPYIPSSSLKGAVRHCWIQERHQGNESEALKDALFVRCFGTGAENDLSASTGQLIFFDAFPEDCFTIVLDVQTPHFKDYYESTGKKHPTDAISPVPIFFPAVTKTKYTIFIGAAEGRLSEEERSKVREMVMETLSEYGLGAKTALGYGLGK